MKAIIAKKEAKIKEISDFLKTAKSFVVFEYQGLNAATITEVRKGLKKDNSKLFVLKNNILGRSLKDANIQGFDDLLTGPNAIAMAFEDEISIFKKIADIKKEYSFVKIKGGYINGSYIDEAQVKELSSIPNREGLYGMVLSCLTSPIRSFLYAIKAVSETKSE